ncbi:MAG: M24 family metallopeptidase [Bacteroidetes bacterium]|jgi:Xaa-Pro aminopeptidase|nr:M24 family metallopeptidase [Bacteroidota bacterium]
MKTTVDKLDALRQVMREAGIDAYIIPSQDPHQSEYVADHWQARRWLTGFDGSAGTAVVTQEEAGVWTDSRYFIQAEEQLKGSGFELQKLKVPHTAEHMKWLAEQLPEGATVGCNGELYTVQGLQRMERALHKQGLQLNYEHDLIDEIWEDRPPLPQAAAFELALPYAGQSRRDKLTAVREKLEHADYYLVTALDSIAWLLNVRGRDIDCNPVVISYLLVGKEQAHWFVDSGKVPGELRQALRADSVQLHDYASLQAFIAEQPSSARIGYTPATTSILLHEQLPAEQWVKQADPIAPLKAIRNEVEQQQLRSAMQKDGVALVRFYRWLEAQLEKGTTLSEYDLGERLEQFRQQQEQYFGPSFPPIVGYKGNGAIVHYRAEAGKSATIKPEGILLIDSGGQYYEGTTDITRTVALGPFDQSVKTPYTLVLKGNIALSRAVFPQGTTGVQLDTLARSPLWQAGLNFGHGTGHGVGHFLNVHEGPQGITPNPLSGRGQTPLMPGMLTSNEPGYYKAGAFGIRIENLELCEQRLESTEEEDTPFLGFTPQTLFPISTALIDKDLLDAEERAWLNEYHARVFDELSPLLEKEEQAWLRAQCQAI